MVRSRSGGPRVPIGPVLPPSLEGEDRPDLTFSERTSGRPPPNQSVLDMFERAKGREGRGR